MMANKFGINFGGGIKELKLGRTFNKGCKDESYHTIRYDFKPASVDPHKDGTLEVVDKEVTLTIPTEGGGLSQAAVFKGNKLPASKDCLLIIDHETGEIILERISQNIRVKKTRAEGSSKKILPRAMQPESRLLKASSSQNHLTNSPHVPRPSPSHTGRSPSSKSPTQKNVTSNKIQNNSSSMPMLNFEEDNKPMQHNSIMSDSSSDSESNSGSSSSSDSDSDSEPEVPPAATTNGFNGAANKNHKSPSSILSDLELSEED